VSNGELEWTIKGMSWLRRTLDQTYISSAKSDVLSIGSSAFVLEYSPERSLQNEREGLRESTKSSLCIVHVTEAGLTFRHSFFIKRNDGEFVQWGETREEGHAHVDTEEWAFGPDTEPDDDSPAAGIFGLSHEELLRSEWVEDDALTVKVKLEVREPEEMGTSFAAPPALELPPPTITSDLLAQLDGADETGDVTFVVQGERLRAHALILCARSEVFSHMLRGSMREAASREVTVKECDAFTFRALLRYLYTDDLVAMEAWVKEKAAENGGKGGGKGGESGVAAGFGSERSLADKGCIALLQCVLAVSHRYQVALYTLLTDLLIYLLSSYSYYTYYTGYTYYTCCTFCTFCTYRWRGWGCGARSSSQRR
jgi:hypothetical protein